MTLSNIQLNNSFKSKKVVKVIAGINNTNISEVTRTAIAAQLAGASYLDINANVTIVKFLKSFLSIPLCISSIDPLEIYNCVISGADLVEIGNYDCFYENNIYITSKQLVNLVQEVKFLIGDKDICVTIPSYMDLHQQINLAYELENLGVDILQTEGLFNNESSIRLSSSTNTLLPSLLSTYAISNSVNIPVITSSGMLGMFSNIPCYYGAAGVGVGSIIRQKSKVVDMVKCINEIRYSMNSNLDISSQLINTTQYGCLIENINSGSLII